MSSRSVIVCLLLLSCFLLPFGIGCNDDPLSVNNVEKSVVPDSLQIVDYPRWGFGGFSTLHVDALPVSRRYDPQSAYIGISVPKSGTCHYLPTHVYHWNDSTPVRLDIWITTRCANPTQRVGNYDYIRVLFDTRITTEAARFPDYHNVTLRVEGRGGATEKSFVIGRGVTDWINDPSGACRDKPERWLVASSKMFPIPTLYTCLDNQERDTVKATITFQQPFLNDSAQSAPEVSLLVFELIDTKNAVAVRTPFYFYAGKTD